MTAGLVAVIFVSTRTGEDEAGYAAADERMAVLARRSPGFVGVDSVSDGDRSITVSYWVDEDAARAWKQDVEHAEAQRLGRDRWYERYTVTVATVTRQYSFSAGAGADGRDVPPPAP